MRYADHTCPFTNLAAAISRCSEHIDAIAHSLNAPPPERIGEQPEADRLQRKPSAATP